MKRFLLIFVLCLMALSMRSQNQTVPEGYVDLGLPSGTLWKASNESGVYSYDDAVKRFGDALPSMDQWDELMSYCKWSWIGSGYMVTSANGNFIILPALGSSHCDGVIRGVGDYGEYIVLDHYEDNGEGAWFDFGFDESEKNIYSGDNFEYFGCISVRLVQN